MPDFTRRGFFAALAGLAAAPLRAFGADDQRARMREELARAYRRMVELHLESTLANSFTMAKADDEPAFTVQAFYGDTGTWTTTTYMRAEMRARGFDV